MIERPTTFVDTAFTSIAEIVKPAVGIVCGPATKLVENMNETRELCSREVIHPIITFSYRRRMRLA